jgi:NADH:ubiquinone oxidoreductase subunit F (NADH-binding)
VEFHAPLLPRRQIRGLQFGRRRAGYFQGSRHPALQPAFGDRRDGHCCFRDGRCAWLQLHSRRSLGDLRALRGGARRSACGRLPGQQSLGSGFNFELFAHHGYGAYICGEETALLESIEGKKGQPRFKPPFPASFGLYGKPTTINNTETFASIPYIINLGGEAYLDAGKANNGGTKLFSISGHVNRPGNYEIPLGTPFATLLEMAGGMRGGRQLKACIPGGSSSPVVPGRQ